MTNSKRELIVISGYYGFNNLGDEAILEELLLELEELTDRKNILVLSNNPESTKARYDVRAANRWKLSAIAAELRHCRLFISGGGGLFQDTASVRSIIYYGGLILLARVMGAKVLVYAQGLGPLSRPGSDILTRAALKQAHCISVRDDDSFALLKKWGIAAKLTCDPVWKLSPGNLPADFAALDMDLGRYFGVSLREGGGFSEEHIKHLAEALSLSLPADYRAVLLPLQKELDDPPLAIFKREWEERGRRILPLPTDRLVLPSQWLNLCGKLDFIVGMRLHSLIMALNQGRPVVAISYDPKVEKVIELFKQASLPYKKHLPADSEAATWSEIIARTAETAKATENLVRTAETCRQKAFLNFKMLEELLRG